MSNKKPKVGHMTADTLKAAIVEEFGKPEPRIDAVTRLVGRYNRIRGRHLHRSMLQLIGKPDAQNKANALLGNDR